MSLAPFENQIASMTTARAGGRINDPCERWSVFVYERKTNGLAQTVADVGRRQGIFEK